MKDKKIFISGPSGIGKTTLARYLANRYNIPFINGSTKELWPKFNIKTHQELIYKTTADIAFGLEFQFAVLDLRKEKIKGLTTYVSDRGPVDNVVYFTTQLAHTVEATLFEKYLKACAQNIPKEHTTFINLELNTKKFKPEDLENDDYRVNNYYYQVYTAGVFKTVIEEDWLGLKLNNNVKLINMDEWDWQKRMEIIQEKLWV